MNEKQLFKLNKELKQINKNDYLLNTEFSHENYCNSFNQINDFIKEIEFLEIKELQCLDLTLLEELLHIINAYSDFDYNIIHNTMPFLEILKNAWFDNNNMTYSDLYYEMINISESIESYTMYNLSNDYETVIKNIYIAIE